MLHLPEDVLDGTCNLTLISLHTCFFYIQNLPEFKNRFVLEGMHFISREIIKVQILNKVSGMIFSSLKLKVSGCALQPLRMKGFKNLKTDVS